MKENFIIKLETLHIDDNGKLENVKYKDIDFNESPDIPENMSNELEEMEVISSNYLIHV